MATLREIGLKRVYEPASPSDGKRILVERLWPRGLSKSDAAVDLWMKEVAPSTELRKWYNHDVALWDEFQRKYRLELDQKPELIAELTGICRKDPVTFVYAARDEQHNSALFLKGYIQNLLSQ